MSAAHFVLIAAGPMIGWLIGRYAARRAEYEPPRLFTLACALAGLAAPVWAAFAAPTGAFGGTFVLSCLLGWLLLALAAIDALTRILPNPLNFAVLALGALMVALTRPDAWLHHLIGGLAGYLILLCAELAYLHLRGRRGLGRGDAKLLGALGVWTGWISLPSILLIASLTGLAYTVIAERFSRRPLTGASSIAFGPWLAFAGWIVWLHGALVL
ncbi:MAG: A24 family peptidase [Maricaulaceae bacterium]|jgi:leader peptidase (prepilin peptidase)/N-methyltransferase